MGRPRSTAGGRPVAVSTKLSVAEAADMDERRGPLSRAEYLRWLLLQARKRGERFGDT
jgi:hypothetical protein